MLLFVGLIGLLSAVAAFLPWETTVGLLRQLEIHGVPTHLANPIIEYWLMMMAALCGVIGWLYCLAGWQPVKYRTIVPLLGWWLVVIVPPVAFHGLRLHIPPWPLYADLVICVACGTGIVWYGRKLPTVPAAVELN